MHDKHSAHPAVGTAQMHDWLQEYHPGFLHTSPKAVYNFVMVLRQKYNIPLEEMGRVFFAVKELPYGQQAKADFGYYVDSGTSVEFTISTFSLSVMVVTGLLLLKYRQIWKYYLKFIMPDTNKAFG